VSDFNLKEILPIVIWVIIMIVSGRIKKKRKNAPVPTKGRQQRQQPSPRPAQSLPPAVAPPPRLTLSPTPRRATVAAPPSSPPIRRVVPTGLDSVVERVFGKTVWGATLGAQMRARGASLRDPFQLLGWVDEVAESALDQLDDLSERLTQAGEQAIGTGEFNAATIDEFVQRSPQLAVTWSRCILADALGLALFGSGFADMREQVEGHRSGRDVVQLAVAGDVGAVRIPYSVRRRVLDAGIRAFDMEAGWAGSEGWQTADEEIVFNLGGLQQIRVPTDPMADAAVAILQETVRMRIPPLDGRDLLEVFSMNPGRGRMRQHLELIRTLPTGRKSPVEENDLLPVLMRLHSDDPTGNWEAQLIALAELRPRDGSTQGRRPGRSGIPIGRRSRAALVEGILLTEVLGVDLGRPSAPRRAGGRG